MREVAFEEIVPYLNPTYWNGHSIGYGPDTQTSHPDLAPLKSPISRATKQNLKERIASMERVVPVETVTTGETFDPDNYNQSTLVMFRQEVLKSNPIEHSLDVKNLNQQKLPVPQTTFALGFGSRTNPSEFMVNDSLTYANRIFCGVVDTKKHSKDTKHILHAAPARLIERIGGGKVLLSGALFRTYENPVRVGETIHTTTKSAETLLRINLLEVISYGEREVTREKVKGILGRLSFGS
jgi:hypothetical protein